MSIYRRTFPEGVSKRMHVLMSEAENISELKRAQCIYFRSEYNLSPQQIAHMTGYSVGTVRNLHSAFFQDGEVALKLSGKGGRYHAYLTEEEEASWLGCFLEAGKAGGILEISKIHTSFEEKIGHEASKSTIYRLLHRHGWRKIAPRPHHPKFNAEVAGSFKKTSQTLLQKPRQKQRPGACHFA